MVRTCEKDAARCDDLARRCSDDVSPDLNSSKLTVIGTYSILFGQVTAQHIHGPAAAGSNAGIVFTLTNTATAGISFEGTFTLTDRQVSDL